MKCTAHLQNAERWEPCRSAGLRCPPSCHGLGPGVTNVRAGPEAQQRAFQRFQANRAKRLGTLLPWWDDSNAETSLARSYVDQQLELGISNEAVAVPRPPPAARAGEGVPAASTPNTSRARSGIIIPPPQPPSGTTRSSPAALA